MLSQVIHLIYFKSITSSLTSLVVSTIFLKLSSLNQDRYIFSLRICSIKLLPNRQDNEQSAPKSSLATLFAQDLLLELDHFYSDCFLLQRLIIARPVTVA